MSQITHNSPSNHSVPVVTPTAKNTAVADDASSELAKLPPPVKRPETTQVWGTQFAIVDMPATLELAQAIIDNRRPEYFVTANLNYLMLTEQHPRLEEINRDAAAVIADGQPIVRRSRRGGGVELPERVAGSDLIVELAKLSAERGYSIYFLGAAPGVGQAAADELVSRFPGLKIAGVQSPPFRQLTAAEHQAMVSDIQSSGADILLVAFGQPKGECWIYDNLHELNVPLNIQLGASFDFLAGTAKRAPKFWQRIGCEWLYRALSDPRRLIPRYGMNILFLASLIAGDLVGKRSPRKVD